MKNFYKWYNQSLERYTRNWCSVYTLFQILQLQWGITVDNDFIIKTLQEAEKDKVWYETRGAYFWKIYERFSKKIYERTGVKVTVAKISLKNPYIIEFFKNDYAFWLWLRKTWLWYKKAREDGILNKDDLLLYQWVEFWHNHTYYKNTVIDSIWVLQDKPLKMKYDDLVSFVDKWIYYENARTLVMEDKLLEKYLKLFKKWKVIENVEELPLKDQRAIARASKLRIFKK